MTIYARPDELVFAENANPGEVVDFPNIPRGWGLAFEQTEGKPSMEWMNSVMKRQDQAIRYLLQRGIAEWSQTDDYPSDAFVQHAGTSYRSLVPNKDIEPGTSAITWAPWGLGIATTEDAQELTNDARALTPKKLADALEFLGISPAGIVAPFAGPVANIPQGWLLCDFSTVSRATYAKLFARIGTTYGAGDGSTTFNVPELRGEIARGLDNGRGVDPGRALGSAQGDAIRNFTGQAGAFYGPTISDSTGAFQVGQFGVDPAQPGNVGGSPGANYRLTLDPSLVVPTAAENRMRNIAMNYIIKY